MTGFNSTRISKLVKCSLWFVLTLAFSLSQNWRDFLSMIFVKQGQQIVFEDFILSGSLLFFSIVLISSLTIDHHFFRNHTRYSSGVHFFLFSLFPMFMFLMCLSLFFESQNNKPSNIDISALAMLEFALLLMTAIYAIAIKLFSLENGNQK